MLTDTSQLLGCNMDWRIFPGLLYVDVGGRQPSKMPATHMTAVRKWIQFIKLKTNGAAVSNPNNYIMIIASFTGWCDQAAGLRLRRSRRLGQQQHNSSSNFDARQWRSDWRPRLSQCRLGYSMSLSFCSLVATTWFLLSPGLGVLVPETFKVWRP